MSSASCSWKHSIALNRKISVPGALPFIHKIALLRKENICLVGNNKYNKCCLQRQF